MAVLSTLGLVFGGASMVSGLFGSSKGSDTAQQGYALQQQGSQIQAEAAKQQAAISKEQAASSVTFAGKERDINNLASQRSITAANQSYGINSGTIQAEQQIQAQQAQAMEIDARRQQLEVIRNQQRNRALALATGVGQAGQGAISGSALQGAYGQASGQSGVNLLGIQQNLQIGRNIYGLNQTISGNQIAMNDLQHTYALQQAQNQTAKSNLSFDYAVSNAGFQTRLADTQTLMSQGQGLINQGSGLVSQGQMQMQSGSSMMGLGQNLFSLGMNADKLWGSSIFGSFKL